MSVLRQYSVLVSAHDYGEPRNVLGRVQDPEVTEAGLRATIRYFESPEARWAFVVAEEGLAAFSVGFAHFAWRDGDGLKAPRRTFTDVEPIEVSQVVVPSGEAPRRILVEAHLVGSR